MKMRDSGWYRCDAMKRLADRSSCAGVRTPGSASCRNSAYCSVRPLSMRCRSSEPVPWWIARKLPATTTVTIAEIASARRARRPRGRNRLITRRHQPVADRAHRLDRRRLVFGGELAAQVADVHLEHARARVVVVPPDRIQDLGTGEHLVRVAHQVGEQLELSRREVDFMPRPLHPARAEVEPYVPGLE